MVQIGAKMRGLCSVDLTVSTQRFQNEQIKKLKPRDGEFLIQYFEVIEQNCICNNNRAT